jgi:hypothetical protein
LVIVGTVRIPGAGAVVAEIRRSSRVDMNQKFTI